MGRVLIASKMYDLKFSNYFTIKFCSIILRHYFVCFKYSTSYMHPSFCISSSLLCWLGDRWLNTMEDHIVYTSVLWILWPNKDFLLLSGYSAQVWFFEDVWCSLPSGAMKVTFQLLHYVYCILDMYLPVLEMPVLICYYVGPFTSSKRKN